MYSYEDSNILVDEQEAKGDDDNKFWKELIAYFPIITT